MEKGCVFWDRLRPRWRALKKGASLSVSAEVAKAHVADEGADGRAGLLRCARNPANRRVLVDMDPLTLL